MSVVLEDGRFGCRVASRSLQENEITRVREASPHPTISYADADLGQIRSLRAIDVGTSGFSLCSVGTSGIPKPEEKKGGEQDDVSPAQLEPPTTGPAAGGGYDSWLQRPLNDLGNARRAIWAYGISPLPAPVPSLLSEGCVKRLGQPVTGGYPGDLRRVMPSEAVLALLTTTVALWALPSYLEANGSSTGHGAQEQQYPTQLIDL
ncbi:hypothetical protein SODALDRAFT_357821 [Sodiomyces alkalinus F11]|uniref:Uncharacterized protein n=1 Tax=Sodiomyces alkalinus (strain CBS 110278 / VKM F-3762 / F11) TaxID=1314773 RepID=A0A3N2Q504_SODAK|nr:hypothetical protein SODALDRAFT_357821 [Sodiomyces alkalinus F11]ROT41738.1 hypothetical protein SODALDRAFT_357821 [Sodiomyces alkalinus F11]